MKVIIYSRVSTDKQTFAQQERTVNEWLSCHGLTATDEVSEAGVSGKVSYKSRNLGRVVLPMLERGDILIVSEVSRIGRSMCDINKFVNDELKPRGVRLVIVQMGLDIDCANLKAIDEMLLFSFSFAAQLERELIQERTQSAIEVLKRKLKDDGQFVSKKGRVCHALGRPKENDTTVATTESAINRKEEARQKPYNKAIWQVLKACTENFSVLGSDRFDKGVEILNGMGVKSATGKEFTRARLRSAYYNLRSVFTDYRPIRKDSAVYRNMVEQGEDSRTGWREYRQENGI